MKRLRALSVTLLAVFGLMTTWVFAAVQGPATDQKTAPAAASQQTDPAPLAERPMITPASDDKASPADEKKAKAEAARKNKEEAAAAAKKAKEEKQAADKKAKNSKNDPETIGDRDVSKGINLYSLEKEIAMGKQLAQEVERQAKIVDDPIVAEYVNRIGQSLVRNSDAKVPFTIKVIDSDDINAFALPGGFFFVNTGVLLNADNEAEMAGVMAHEIAHVAARHGTRQASKGTLLQIGTIPLIFVGGWGGYIARQSAGILVPLSYVSFTRPYEREADYLGLQYLYKAGYDPTAFVDFFEKIQTMDKKKPGTVNKIFSSHPMTDDRIKAAQEEIQKILVAKPEYVLNTSEFDDVKGRLMMLQSRRKVDGPTDPSRPTLRRAPGANGDPGTNTSPSTGDTDDRPTLKRRDGSDPGTQSPNATPSTDTTTDDRPTLKRRDGGN